MKAGARYGCVTIEGDQNGTTTIEDIHDFVTKNEAAILTLNTVGKNLPAYCHISITIK